MVILCEGERSEVFTGIIEEIGEFKHLEHRKEGASLQIKAEKVTADLRIGDSIAVNGACLTVTSFGAGSFTAAVMPETLRKTNLHLLRAGEKINLERALSANGRFGGHIVLGHVDGTIVLRGRKMEGSALLLSFATPLELLRYIVSKGSVCLDGVSLTVVSVSSDGFSVSLVSHTLDTTALELKENGSLVNLETDIIGKYVDKLLTTGKGAAGREKGVTAEEISFDLLYEKGFI